LIKSRHPHVAQRFAVSVIRLVDIISIFYLGAGGRRFESGRPDHFLSSGVPPGCHRDSISSSFGEAWAPKVRRLRGALVKGLVTSAWAGVIIVSRIRVNASQIQEVDRRDLSVAIPTSEEGRLRAN
jgi:hypothetical protein